MSSTIQDQAAIDHLINRFFDLFTNTDGRRPNLRIIDQLFIPEGLLINNSNDSKVVYDLDSFISPREEILTNGTLVDFSEWETTQKTDIFESIAQRNCQYEKSGILNGEPYQGKGRKLMQLVKFRGSWKLSSVIWCDES